uniref:Uncharacterized protein n=1 Tax=Rhizophora mucronata TaxID=61149 RepID=A0A2P2Q827_RHIMU
MSCKQNTNHINKYQKLNKPNLTMQHKKCAGKPGLCSSLRRTCQVWPLKIAPLFKASMIRSCNSLYYRTKVSV